MAAAFADNQLRLDYPRVVLRAALKEVGAKMKVAMKLLTLGIIIAAACGCSSQYSFDTAVRHFYDLKISANGERMTKAALQACEADRGCSSSERTQLQQAWIVADADYKAKRVKVERDRAAGYHANMSNLPAFGQDPSLGFDSL